MVDDSRSPFQEPRGDGWYGSFWWVPGVAQRKICQGGNTDYYAINTFQPNGNSLSWYTSGGNSQNSTTQCNYTGSTYFYIEIGA